MQAVVTTHNPQSDVAPTSDIWTTSIEGHAARNWPQNWQWKDLLARISAARGTLTPMELWDVTVFCHALVNPTFKPKARRNRRLHNASRAFLALKYWSQALLLDIQHQQSRDKALAAIRRNLARLGHEV